METMDNKPFSFLVTKPKRRAPSPPRLQKSNKSKPEMSKSTQPKLNSLSFKLFQKNTKKNAPPRPPPPKFSSAMARSKSLQLKQNKPKSTVPEMCLIDFSSPPNSPQGGSGSDGLSLRSFSSEASSSNQSGGPEEPFDPFGSIMDQGPPLTTSNTWSKDPFEDLGITTQAAPNNWPTDPFESIALRNKANKGSSVFYSAPEPPKQKSRATIIRPKKPLTKSVTADDVTMNNNNVSTALSLSNDTDQVDGKRKDVPHATVLYDLDASQPGDLSLTAGQTIQLLYRINDDWLFGRCGNKEGMFPQTFVKIEVDLLETRTNPGRESKEIPSHTAKALYDFNGEVQGDLSIREGDVVTLLGKVNDEWLSAELNGLKGLIPTVYVDHVPSTLPTVAS